MTNPLDCAAVLTVSDTRTLDQDTSGQYLHDALLEMGHQVVAREILPDEVYQIRAQVCQWIAQPSPHVILITGGTGFSGRDGAVQAVRPILDEADSGIWRAIPSAPVTPMSAAQPFSPEPWRGCRTIPLWDLLPGSTGACRLAFEKILREQLDSTHKPCNFVNLLLRGDARRGSV